MVLPGAAELVEAFAALPPGEVRDSAVSHVQVLAKACGWIAPNDIRVGEQPGAVEHHLPPRLPSPFAEGLQSRTVEGQIVERAMRGERPEHIADDMRVKLGLVIRLMAKARKEGGVAFPGDADQPATAKKPKGKLKRQGAGKLFGVPVPPPPYWWEDPLSPIWDNPSMLPTLSESGNGTMAGLGPLDSKSFKVMSEAAGRHGMTLRQYIAQRYEILRRIEAGDMPSAVAIDMRVTGYTVYGLLTKVGRNRMAVMMAEKTAADGLGADGASPHRGEAQGQPTGTPGAAAGGRHGQNWSDPRRGPERWGFPDLDSYEAARLRVRNLRLQGVGPGLIAEQIDMPIPFVKNALDHWQDQGAKWPAITKQAPRGTAAKRRSA
jgi:hypothetical protein